MSVANVAKMHKLVSETHRHTDTTQYIIIYRCTSDYYTVLLFLCFRQAYYTYVPSHVTGDLYL